jgi:hypothetical protein
LTGELIRRWPWLPALLVVPVFVGIAWGGAQVGSAIGAVIVAVILVVTVRSARNEPIEVAQPGPGVPGGILVIALVAIEDPRTAGIVAAIGDPSRPEAGEEGLLVLAPARTSRLDRWADDIEGARFESQRVLTVSLATMAAAGLPAEGRVGDGDVVQATEDVLRSYAATEVAIVARPGDSERQIRELERRLPVKLRRVEAAKSD